MARSDRTVLSTLTFVLVAVLSASSQAKWVPQSEPRRALRGLAAKAVSPFEATQQQASSADWQGISDITEFRQQWWSRFREIGLQTPYAEATGQQPDSAAAALAAATVASAVYDAAIEAGDTATSEVANSFAEAVDIFNDAFADMHGTAEFEYQAALETLYDRVHRTAADCGDWLQWAAALLSDRNILQSEAVTSSGSETSIGANVAGSVGAEVGRGGTAARPAPAGASMSPVQFAAVVAAGCGIVVLVGIGSLLLALRRRTSAGGDGGHQGAGALRYCLGARAAREPLRAPLLAH